MLGPSGERTSANACSEASPRGWGETVNKKCLKQEQKSKPVLMLLAGLPPPFHNDGHRRISNLSVGTREDRDPSQHMHSNGQRDRRHYTASASCHPQRKLCRIAQGNCGEDDVSKRTHQQPIAYLIYSLGTIRTCDAMHQPCTGIASPIK